MDILITIGYIFLCVLMFSLAIAIHEFGHFIVALKLGLKVERFSIGFGPAIWRKTINGVEYRLSWIPLGGYVSIPDVDPEGTKALEGEKGKGDEGTAKRKIPAWKELLVAVAGPAMNIVLAVVLAVVLSLIPSAKFGELTTEIGGFASGSVAKEAGLRAGDIVVSVGGHPVTTWSELQTEVQISNGEPTEFVVRRPVALTEVRTLKLTATDGDFGFVCVTNRHPAVVGGFWGEASVAEKAGLKVGDRIVSFNGARVTSEQDLVQEIDEADTERPSVLEVRRGEELLKLEMTPVPAKRQYGNRWILGNCLQLTCATNDVLPIVAEVVSGGAAERAGLRADDTILSVGGAPVATRDAVLAALAAAGSETELSVMSEIPADAREYEEKTVVIAPKRNPSTGAFFIEATSVANETGAVAWMPDRNPFKQLAWDAGSIFRVLKALVTPKEAKGTSKAVGGPVLIAEGIYRSMRRDFNDGLGFLRFLNTNLAVMNLLPIPVLDGGLILFALITIVFRRRVPEKVVGWLSMGFMYLLLGLMALLIFTDSLRSWRIHHADDPADAIELVRPEDVYAF